MLRSAIAALTAIALATPTLALGAASTLYTTQAQYCAQPTDIYVNAFSAVYHKSNQSIVFYLALDTTNSNVDVTARVQVNAYNDTLISQEIDLCQLLGGVLCPLPSLNISTYGTYQFPNDLANSIPSLAWTVPDLEAYARLELVQTDGSDALCIEAPLSNGLTAGHAAVGYATGIFTGLAVIIGLIHSACNTASPAQYRWFDILYLYQFSASLGMLNLDYPTVWRAVSKQFFWSFSLFHSEQMQSSINSMRYKTGGYLNPSIVDSALFIPGPSDYSRYSSLNTIINRLRLIASALSGGDLFGGLFKREISQYAGTGVNEMIKRDIIPEGESAITSSVIANYDDLVQRAGLAVYTTSINIPYPNALTTIFFFFLAWIGIFLVVHLIIYLVTLAMARGTHFGAIDFKRRFYLWMNGNALWFICIMWLYPLWIFGFFQFRIRDSKLAIFWAVMGIVLTFIPLLVVFILSIFRHRRHSSTSPGVSPLYTSYKWFHSAGAVYRQYRPRMNWFWMVLVLAMIARAGFVAFGPRNGWAQVIGIMVVEVIVLVLLLALRPHKDKKGDWLAPVLSFLRLAMAGLCIAFLPAVNVAGIPRTVIGFVLIAIVGVTSIILFFGLIFNLFYGWLFRRHSDRIEDGLEVERSANWVGSSSRETKRPMTQVTSTRSPVDSTRTSADLLGNAQGRNRNSIIEPVGDNSYSYPGQGQGQGQAGYASGYGAGNDHDAYARNVNGNGNGNFGMGPTLAPPVDHRTSMLGGGSRSRTPSYRRSQYGGSVRNSGTMTPTYNGNNQYNSQQYA